MEKKEERKNVLITVYVFILYNIFNIVWMWWFKNDLYVFSQPIGIVKWLIKFCTATSYPIIMAYTAKLNYTIAQMILNNSQTKKHRFIEFAVLFGVIHFVIKNLSNDIADFTFVNYMSPYKEYRYNKIILYYLLVILIGVIPSICAIINKIKNRQIIRKIAQFIIKSSGDIRIFIILAGLYLFGNIGIIVYESKFTRLGIYDYLFESLKNGMLIILLQIDYYLIIYYLIRFAIDKLLKNRMVISYAIGVVISCLIIICYDIVEILLPFCLSDYEVFFDVSILIITIVCMLKGIVEAIKE